MNSSRIQTAAINKKAKQTINNALENALKRSNTTTTLETTAAATAAITTSTAATVGASSVSFDISAVGGNVGCSSGEESIVAINNSKKPKIEKQLKNEILINNLPTQFFHQKNQQQQKQLQQNKINNIETLKTISTATLSSSSPSSSSKLIYDQQQLSGTKEIGGNNKEITLPANITLMDENKKIYKFATAGGSSVGGGLGSGSASGNSCSGSTLNINDTKSSNEDLIVVHNISGNSIDDPIGNNSNQGVDNHLNDEYLVYTSGILDFEGEEYCINPSQLTTTSSSSTTSKKSDSSELSTTQQVKKVNLNDVVSVTTSSANTTIAKATVLSSQNHDQKMNQNEAIARNIQAEEVQLVMMPNTGSGGPSNIVVGKDNNKQHLMGNITKLENVQLKSKITQQQQSHSTISPLQQNQQQQSTTTMLVTTTDLRNKAVTYSRIGNIQTTSTGPFTATTILNRVNMQTALKNQPLIVTTKRVSEGNSQPTAKVSIGNTTISVPLLKPMSSHLIQTSSGVVAAGAAGNLTSATMAHNTELTKLNSQPVTLNASSHFGKILNIKRGPKNTQPTIVSLSQLQIKPVSSAKIVQAKVVGKKMPIQLSNATTMALATSSTSVNTNSGIVTISAAKPKPLSSSVNTNSITTTTTTHLHNLTFQKAPQMSIIPDSTPPQTLLECEASSTDSSEPMEVVTVQIPPNKISPSNNNENLQMLLLNKGPLTQAQQQQHQQNHTQQNNPTEKVSLTLDSSSNSNVLKNVLAAATVVTNKSSTPPSLAPLSKHMDMKTSSIQLKANINSSLSIVKQSTPRFITTSAGEATIVSTTNSVLDATSNLQGKVGLLPATSNQLPDNLKSSTAAVINIPRNISLTLAKSGPSNKLSTASTCVTTTLNSVSNSQTSIDSNAEQHTMTNNSLEFLSKKLNASVASDNLNVALHRSSPQPIESPVKQQPSVGSTLPLKQNENSNSSNSSTNSALPPPPSIEQKLPQLSEINKPNQIPLNSVQAQMQLKRSKSTDEVDRHSHQVQTVHTSTISNSGGPATITYILSSKRHSVDMYSNNQTLTIQPHKQQQGIITSSSLLPDGIIINKITDPSFQKDNLKVENSIILTPVTQTSVASTSSSVSVTPNATPPPPPPKSDESYNVLLKKLLQNNSSNSSQSSNHSSSTSSTTTSSSATLTTSSSLSSALSSSTLSSSISTSNSGTINSSLSSSVSLSSAIASTTTSPMCNQLLSNRKVINVRAPSLGLVSSLEAQLARPVLPPVPTVTPSTQTLLMSSEPILSSSLSSNNSTVKTTTITQEMFKKQNLKPSSQQSETSALQSNNSGSSSSCATGNINSSLSTSSPSQQSSISGGSLTQITTNQQQTTSHGQHSQHSPHITGANRNKPIVQIISKETSFISFPSQNVQQQHTTGNLSSLSIAGSQTSSLLVGDNNKNLVSSITNPRETPPKELFAPTSQHQPTQSQLQPLIIHSNSFPSINKTISISTKSKDNKDTTTVQGQHQAQPNPPPPPYKMSRATNVKEQGRKTPIDAASDDSNSSNSKLGSTYLNSNASNSNSSITSNQIKSPIPSPSPVSKSDSKSSTIKSIFTLPKSTILRADTPTLENLNLIATNPPSQLPNEIFQTDNNDSNSNQFSNDFKSSTTSSFSSSSTAPAVEFGNLSQQQPMGTSSAMSEKVTLKTIQQSSTNVFTSSLQQAQNQSKQQQQQQQPQSVQQIVIQQQKTPSTPSTPTPTATPTPTQNQIAQTGSQSPPPPPPYSSAIASTSFTSSPQMVPTTPTQTPASTPTTPSTTSQASTSLNAGLQNQQHSVIGTPSSSVKASPETPQKQADAEMRKKRKREYQKNRRQIINSNKEQNQSSTGASGRGSLSPSAATSTTPTSKKRARKVSKFEEDYDSFIDNLMTHIRSMQPLEIMEPDLNPNLAMHTIYGAIEGLKVLGVKEGDMSQMDKYLVGDFANALPENCENIYESPAAFRASKNHQKQNTTNHNKFYDQEFQPITHKKKEDKISKLIAAIRDRNLDTLDLIPSPTSKQSPSSQKENIVEENRKWFMELDYPGLYFTNTTNTHCFGRMSPIVPLIKPFASRKRNCYTFEPLKELDVDDLCSTEIKEEAMDVDMETDISEKIKKEVDTESIVLALHPSVANSIIDVLQDLAKLLQVSPAIAYKIIETQQDEDDDDELSDIKRIKTEEECEESQTAALINLQKIITGQIRLCRQCGEKAGEIQVLLEHHMNHYFKPNMEIDITKPIGSYLYFCSEKCQTQYNSGDATGASPPPLNIENNENLVLKVEQEGDTSTEAKRKHPSVAACNNASSTNGSGATGSEPAVKRKRYKYFTPSNQTLGPALYRRPSEKEVTDLLFKMDITLSAYMSDLKDNRQCVFCHHFGDGLADGPSRLLNFDVDKWVHLNCALWSNGVYETISGGLMNFQAALQAAFNQTCTTCQEVGATVKCFKNRCGAVYHLPCAIKDSCTFYKNKTIHCQPHASRLEKENELPSLAVHRRVFVERDENRQVATVMHYSDSSNLLRVGSLTFLNVGQLLPHQLEAFHTSNYIYPIGYKMVRMYWSMRRLNKRCRYVCSIDEDGGRPEFRITAQEPDEEDIEFRASTPKAVWQQVLESIANLRKEIDGVQLFPSHINGEDLFGLTEPAIVRIIESLPGVETLTDYRFKYGRNPLLELPLAINPSGAARTEPKQRQLLSYRKPHTQRTAGVSAQRFPNTTAVTTVVTGEMTCPYSKQFVHSKSSQYKKMKQEWRNNVYLARSKIQGLGLYAARDLEKHTMIIEYIGEVIRTEVSEIREKQYEARNRGIYMFRLDEDRVVDATLSGGLARYINHSCNPNCCTEIVEVDREYRIIIFAKRRIHRGEELSYDYKFDIEDDANKISCMCGAPNCRKWMN